MSTWLLAIGVVIAVAIFLEIVRVLIREAFGFYWSVSAANGKVRIIDWDWQKGPGNERDDANDWRFQPRIVLDEGWSVQPYGFRLVFSRTRLVREGSGRRFASARERDEARIRAGVNPVVRYDGEEPK
jgi:hypothetical protein